MRRFGIAAFVILQAAALGTMLLIGGLTLPTLVKQALHGEVCLYRTPA